MATAEFSAHAHTVVARKRDHQMIYVTPPGAHCYRRLFEWMVTLMMIGVACLALSPIGGGAAPQAMLIIMFVVGVTRAVALFLNGNWPIGGPRLRALCAMMGAVIWLQMMMVLARHGGILPIEIPVYLGLTLGEIITCYRSASDVRRRH